MLNLFLCQIVSPCSPHGENLVKYVLLILVGGGTLTTIAQITFFSQTWVVGVLPLISFLRERKINGTWGYNRGINRAWWL